MDPSDARERNMAVVHRLVADVWGRGWLHLIPDLVADDYVGHFVTGDHYGPEGVRIDIVAYRTAFPDLSATLDDLLADGDKVIRRFTLRGVSRAAGGRDVPGESRLLQRVIAIDRLAGAQLVESWVEGTTGPPFWFGRHGREPP